MGTYVPQRVAKLSRAISRLQRRNVRGRERSVGAVERRKKQENVAGEREERSEAKRSEAKVRAAEARESGGMRKPSERTGREGGWMGERRNGAMESIRRYARLNERNVNHKKLRAFKSPTRWCTFALITLHLSFLPRASLSTGGGLSTPPRRELPSSFASLRLSLFLVLSLPPSLFLPLSPPRSVLRPPSSFARSLICIPRKRISPGPFRDPSPSLSSLPFSSLLHRMAALSLVETPRRE